MGPVSTGSFGVIFAETARHGKALDVHLRLVDFTPKMRVSWFVPELIRRPGPPVLALRIGAGTSCEIATFLP